MSEKVGEQELQVFGIVKTEKEGYFLCEPDEEPELYALLYSEIVDENGETKTLAEHEDLSLKEATEIVKEIEASTGLQAAWLPKKP